MNRTRLFLAAAVAVLLIAPAAAAAHGSEDEVTAQVFDAQSAFEAIKALEGVWVGTVSTAPGEEGRETEIVYKVSANGHSVIETYAPGKPHEMFSVYHLDGDDLLMTHYCAIGNAPKMKFQPSTKAAELVFKFNGGTNLDPEQDPHAHEGRMQLLDSDHYLSEAIGFNQGVPSSTQYFTMRRVD